MNLSDIKINMVKLAILAGMIVGLAGGARANSMLLDNLGEAESNLANFGKVVGQAFTTGSAVTIQAATFRHNYGGYAPTAPARLTIQNAKADGTIDFDSTTGLLDTWTDFSDAVSDDDSLVTFSGRLALAANTTYWLVLHDTESQAVRVSSSTHYSSNFGASLPTAINNYESSSNAYFRVEDGPLMFQLRTTAPDGGLTVLLLGLALGGLGYARRMVK